MKNPELEAAGDALVKNPGAQLDAAGISHTFIAGDLIQQQADNDTKWAK
jgi:hypothetical protein